MEIKPNNKRVETIYKNKKIYTRVVNCDDLEKPYALNELLLTVMIVLAGILGGLILGDYLIN